MSQIPDATTGCKTVGVLARQIVVTLIHSAPDRVTKKERLLVAYEQGLLSAGSVETVMHDYGLWDA